MRNFLSVCCRSVVIGTTFLSTRQIVLTDKACHFAFQFDQVCELLNNFFYITVVEDRTYKLQTLREGE